MTKKECIELGEMTLLTVLSNVSVMSFSQFANDSADEICLLIVYAICVFTVINNLSPS